MQESVQVQDAVVWWGFCAIRRGFQVFYPVNARRGEKCEALSGLRQSSAGAQMKKAPFGCFSGLKFCVKT
ncbi:hypothetical protein FNI11_11335 [Salmonella enterica subsp. salamae]|nr:hypothetical protein [Salmonella enterica subsp. salamae]ECJ2283153.1 hypothetical protein [Salmonella enterica subsp. salamae]